MQRPRHVRVAYTCRTGRVGRSGPVRARLGPARGAAVQTRHGSVSCQAGSVCGLADEVQVWHGYSYTGHAGPEARRTYRTELGPDP
jgi:hypothetical protein